MQTTLLPNSRTLPVVADFDADGRADLLLVSATQSSGFISDGLPSTVYYFDPSGLASSVALPSSGVATAADLDGDGRADIALGGSSLFAYRSLATRSFSPILGPSHPVTADTRLYSADLDGDGAREILVARGTSVFRPNTAGTLTRLFDLGVEASLLSDVSGTGNLQSSQKALAILEPEASRIHVYGSIGPGHPDGLLSIVQVTIEAPVGSEYPDALVRLLVVDLNGDGRGDLLALTSLGRAYAAYGVGDGSFNSAQVLPALGSGDGRTKPFQVPGEDEIATAWQSPDATRVDYFPLTPPSQPAPLQQALAADLTGDGLTDVAAVALDPLGVPDIDLFRGTAGGAFNHIAVATDGAPMLREFGDFNGDGQPDLLLTEGLRPGAEQTAISVLFSPVLSNNARVREQLELNQIQGAVAGYLEDDLGNNDEVADVAVLHGAANSALQLSLLEGGADGLLHSSLTSAQGRQVFQSPALGHFRAGQSRAKRDLAVISGTSPFAPSLELFSINEGSSVAVGHTALDTDLTNGQALAVDLDVDGLDEIYVLDVAYRLRQLKLTGGDASPLSVSQVTDLIDQPVLTLASFDVDADGVPDLSLGGYSTVWAFLASERRQGPVLHTFQVPNEHCDSMVAHAWIQADSDATRELALLCNQTRVFNSRVLSIFKADLTADTLTFVDSQPAPTSDALAAGDFNGDGVEDLVTSNGELVLLLGSPR